MLILLSDDDEALRLGLEELLTRGGHRVRGAGNGEEALDRLAGADLLVTDLRMPGIDGIELLRQAKMRRPDIEVIVMTGYGSVPTAIEAMRLGARAYLTKPFEPEELLFQVREVEKLVTLRSQAASGRGRLVGSSEPMRRSYAEIDLAALSDAPALILGETGTGKELAAHAIHDGSRRRAGPFVAVNCGAMPRELIEGELFGHLPGAFTGAQTRRKGRFTLAHGGTLLLDEVDSLPIDMQPKLLRALETGEVWPLGGERPERADVRVLCASNADLAARVADGRFREDLFYRINVLRVQLPPLRDRPEDIPQIVQALAARAGDADGGRFGIAPEAFAEFVARPWPGNVRELVNAVERARVRALAQARGRGGPVLIERGHLDPAPAGSEQLPFKLARERAAEEWSRRTLRAALEASGGNVSLAARNLRMSRTALLRLVARFGLRGEGR